MGYYNDVVVQIEVKDAEKFNQYLHSDFEKNGRVLDDSCVVKRTGDYLVYVWMGNHQLRVSAKNHYFNLEYEMEVRAGFDPEDYVAEMWEEDGDHIKCGKLDFAYSVVMDVLVYNDLERRYV